jgi:3-oxoacyl-[acyl-carrier protein] reductase
MDLGLTGRAAIVTGAGRGIGRAIALALAAEGADVLAVSRGAEALDAVVAEIGSTGGTASALAVDVIDPAAAATIVETCVKRFGRLDILVNNVGGSRAKKLAELTADDWQQALELNFLSAARLSVAAGEVMRRAGWGRIVSIGSTSGKRPDPLFAPYSAAKAALANLTVALSDELAADGVLATCVVAGVTETELIADQAQATAERTGRTADEVMAKVLARTNPPTGRFGKPEEIAAAVAFLCSEQASWITGTTLAVDGGTLRST